MWLKTKRSIQEIVDFALQNQLIKSISKLDFYKINWPLYTDNPNNKYSQTLIDANKNAHTPDE